MVAWFVKASDFHSVNSAPSANGGLNPAWECCIDHLNSKEFVAIKTCPIVERSKSSDSDCGRGPGFESRRGKIFSSFFRMAN